jgi:hypothetical protein
MQGLVGLVIPLQIFKTQVIYHVGVNFISPTCAFLPLNHETLRGKKQGYE